MTDLKRAALVVLAGVPRTEGELMRDYSNAFTKCLACGYTHAKGELHECFIGEQNEESAVSQPKGNDTVLTDYVRAHPLPVPLTNEQSDILTALGWDMTKHHREYEIDTPPTWVGYRLRVWEIDDEGVRQPAPVFIWSGDDPYELIKDYLSRASANLQPTELPSVFGVTASQVADNILKGEYEYTDKAQRSGKSISQLMDGYFPHDRSEYLGHPPEQVQDVVEAVHEQQEQAISGSDRTFYVDSRTPEERALGKAIEDNAVTTSTHTEASDETWWAANNPPLPNIKDFIKGGPAPLSALLLTCPWCFSSYNPMFEQHVCTQSISRPVVETTRQHVCSWAECATCEEPKNLAGQCAHATQGATASYRTNMSNPTVIHSDKFKVDPAQECSDVEMRDGFTERTKVTEPSVATFDSADHADMVTATVAAVGHQMRQFATGATRDTDEGKPDYEGFYAPSVVEAFGDYMTHHRKQADGNLRDSDNWQKGISRDCYMKSLWRHFLDLWFLHRGVPRFDTHGDGHELTFKEVCCAILFNVQGILFEELKEQA